MTTAEKICRQLFDKGKWKENCCDAFCSRQKRLKCAFLDERIREEALKETSDVV